jgi:hypothetical protein
MARDDPSERRPRGVGRHERGVWSRGDRIDESAYADLVAGGAFFPGEFVCPVFSVSRDDKTKRWTHLPLFQGCATLLGGDLFLTARHVAESAASSDGDPWMVAILDLHTGRPRWVFNGVEWAEHHPNPNCDLSIGKVFEWNARGHWAGFGSVTPPDEVFSVGYSADVLAPFHRGDLGALNNPRYRRGYVTRGLDTANDDFARLSSFEVNFALPPGMSGSPIWGFDAQTRERILLGIAIGCRYERIALARHEETLSDGARLIHDVERVEEFGVAVRMGAVLDWPIAGLGGRILHELLPSDATGELPAHLRDGSDYWQPGGRKEPDWPDD